MNKSPLEEETKFYVISELNKVRKVEAGFLTEKEADEFCLYCMHQYPGRWFVQLASDATAL